MKNAALSGKPDAGNPHVRFDEGEVASYPPTVGRPEGVATRGVKPRRGSLLYNVEKLVAVLVVGMASGLAGAETYNASTGYVTLLKSDGKVDGNQTYSLTPGYQYHRWSDNQPLHTGTNYYVGAGLVAQASGDASADIVPTIVCAGSIDPRGFSAKTYTFTDLRMLAGSKISHNQVNTKKGTITILSEDPEAPVQLLYNRAGESGSFQLGAKIVGSERSQLALTKSSATPGSYLNVLSGTDWTEFRGTFSVSDGQGIRANANVPLTTPAKVRFAKSGYLEVNKAGAPFTLGELTFVENAGITNTLSALNVAGLFDTGTNAIWECRGSSTFGHLRLNSGMTLCSSAATAPLLSVTNRLEIGEAVTVNFKKLVCARAGEVAVYPFIRLSPEAVAAGLPDLSGVTAKMAKMATLLSEEPPRAFLAYQDDGAVPGGKVVVITHRPIICTLAGGAGADKLNPDADANLNWEKGVFPQPGYDFYATNALEYAADTVSDFPGDTLTVADNIFITVRKSITLTNLFLYGRATLYIRSANIHLGGKYTWYPRSTAYPGCIQTIADYTVYMDAEMCGSGDVSAHNYYPNKTGSTLYLTGLNTNWTGGLRATFQLQSGSAYVADDDHHERIIVSDGRNLGAPLKAFRHDAVWLLSFSELRTTNTMALPANRGVYIDGDGALTADAGMRLTCGSPLTLNGRLRKAGEGTLVLAGGIRYGLNDDLADTTAATDGKNVIRVDAGDLKVAQAEGVVFDLAAGARFLVDAEMGPLTDTTAAAPFESDDGLLRIAPDAATMEKPEHELVLPLLKVSSAAADAIDAAKMLQVKSAWKGVKCTSVVRSDDNGIATYTGTFEPVGLLLIFR